MHNGLFQLNYSVIATPEMKMHQIMLMFMWSTEEKKATKRSFQKIQEEEEEEEDDYRAHYSPKDPDGSGPQLV